jgi:hypothetical protein
MDYPEVQSVLEDRGFPEEVDGAGIAKRAERGNRLEDGVGSDQRMNHQGDARKKWYAFENFLVRALRVEVNEEKIVAKKESQNSRSEW